MMYDANEYAAEADFMIDTIYRKSCRLADAEVWETKDGLELPIKVMSTNHIRNAIAWIDREDICDAMLPIRNALSEELDRRAEEMA